MSDAQITAQAKNIAWSLFIDNLTSSFSGDALKLEVATIATVKFPLASSPPSDFLVTLRQSKEKSSAVISRLFLPALFYFFQKSKGEAKEASSVKVEIECNKARAKVAETWGGSDSVQKQYAAHMTRMKDLNLKIEAAKKQVSRSTGAGIGPGLMTHDPNDEGPNRYTLHIKHCNNNHPKFVQQNQAALALIRKKYAETNKEASYPIAPSDQELKKLMDAAPPGLHDAILKTLEGVDTWEFDPFTLAQKSNNGALFCTTYALLYKHGLIGYFDIQHETLCQFLGALEAGYHPNHYHNSTHASDVLQCVHFIFQKGGMIKALSLSPEDVFAAIISSAMHDFDHPGFNNNFHCRTNGYLATLYNDRSVLENHHCSQVFELIRHPKYNIFESFSDDQRKDVRDSILEMVLSTDMGLHAKIFQQFRHKLNDNPTWERKDDVRLAMAIAIKMADISNCARADNLYKQWAKRIADEFYIQGDVERSLGLTVSPFMDRIKHKSDFPKGQISFMNYIVIPLFEAGAELLPNMEFTISTIQQNKEYWVTKGQAD
eukprot:NODE_517_length_2008_cov_129.359367_g412_i0.p1 GENE.NODE_517_length_2008_cov_129.359367_g412_i0~~NODE_517_length_2008_cov_129.359367_g412_i0.p1  ORF type:complete len:634 (+),score=190.64 NODE_517_length_2008_cov_129.359367_g412_i0:269-1903(+)